MIPKIQHYVWLGNNPLTPLAEECLASWKATMPDWEIKRWDETNFDIAAAPEYVRLWALEQYGGVYVDTDVKVLKSHEPLLNDTAFIGIEESKAHLPGTCVMGCEPHCKWVRDMLALYDDIEFVKEDGSLDMTTNVTRIGSFLQTKGFEPCRDAQYLPEYGLRIYTHDYFSPITSTRVMRKTKNTYSIHYFAESWRDGQRKHSWHDWTKQPRSAKRQYKKPICFLKAKRRFMQIGSYFKQNLIRLRYK